MYELIGYIIGAAFAGLFGWFFGRFLHDRFCAECKGYRDEVIR